MTAPERTPNPIDLPLPAESTLGAHDEAKRALEESRKANTDSIPIIEAARGLAATVREFREVNHYTPKFRAIIRSAHGNPHP
jgi:hypothetical protein